MSERTVLEAMGTLEKDRFAVQRTVIEIIHLLHDFIPQSCIRDAEDKLFDAFFINGVELTSNTMRKEYERWKETELLSELVKYRNPSWVFPEGAGDGPHDPR